MIFRLAKRNLNFRVYTAETLPETAQENDLCIVSDVKMKNWVISQEEPFGAPRTDGDVWIWYSVDGSTFNLLKTNEMLIATIAAKQYINGKWTEVTAKRYHDGAWVSWSKTPVEYQDIEYIQSTGAQYLKPDFRPDTTNTYRHEFKFNAQNVSTEAYLMGINTPLYNFALLNSNFVMHIGDQTNLIEVPIEANTDYTAEVTIAPTTLTVKINDNTFGPVDCTVKELAKNPYLFARLNSSNNAANNYAKTKLYYWRIYRGSTLIHEFIPCYKKEDSSAGMYDTVNAVFYTNAGTGSFDVGGDV